MARHQIQVDGKIYYIDTELEARVQALEELLQDSSETVKANLEASKAFYVELEEAEAAALAAAANAENVVESPEESPGVLHISEEK